MLFNSYIFLLFFLPLTFSLYFLCNYLGWEKLAQIVLTGMSLFFYAFFHVSYLWVILGSILFNYGCSRLLLPEREKQTVSGRAVSACSLPNLSGRREGCRRLLLVSGILANVGVIFYFKYFHFFMENIQMLFHTSAVLGEVLMPLGISFFTFQQISYLVDSYRGETEDYSILEYTLFVTFFPQLVAGPIVLHQEMISQFRDAGRKRIRQEKVAEGLFLLSVGLAKKVLLADTLGRGVDWGYTHSDLLGGTDTFVVSLLYCLQIYFDFSGYCDMASGIASLFGFELPLNFNSPYKSDSIADFWDRWHISLSRFLQKYLYIPLGGSRKGTVRTLCNLMAVFLVSGIWHGANWTFILWGALHGLASVLHRLFHKLWDRVPHLLRWAATFLFVDLAWILFRAENLQQARFLYGNLLSPWKWHLHSGLLEQFELLEFTYPEEHIGILGRLAATVPALHLLLVLGVALFLALVPRNCHEKPFEPTVKRALVSIVLLVWSILSFSGVSTFLYFNF